MTGSIWERAADDYEQTGVDFFGPLGRELVQRASLRSGDRVLDVGCGRGHVLFPALAAVGPSGRVAGIDLARAMVDLTAEQLAAAGVRNATVQVGDAGAPPFPAGSFDAVLGGFVMFLVSDPAAAIRAFRSLLVDRGRVAFSTYGNEDPRIIESKAILRRWADLPSESADDPFDHVAQIRQLFESNGFEDVEVTDVRTETVFESNQQWWQWAWSVGLRGALEKIPPDRLPEATAEVEQVLTGGSAGQIRLVTQIRYTTAHV